MIIKLLILIWLHMLGDYSFQGDFLANVKGKNDYILFCHAFIWTGCIVLGLWALCIFAWWKVAFLLVGHFAVDRWKARKEDKTHALTKDLWVDQGLHLLQLVMCVLA